MTSQTTTIAAGNGHTIIQIVGDGNRIEPGHPHLALRARESEAMARSTR
jgi:hypothetical protein